MQSGKPTSRLGRWRRLGLAPILVRDEGEKTVTVGLALGHVDMFKKKTMSEISREHVSSGGR
jgi:hypothetical protein